MLFAVTFVSVHAVDEVDDDADLVVEVIGFQWQWQFDYPAPGVSVVGTDARTPELVLPADTSVRFDLTLDRRHPLVLDPRLPLQARHVPGRGHVVLGRRRVAHRVVPEHRRVRRVLRARPHKMRFSVRIVTPDEFEQWLRGPARRPDEAVDRRSEPRLPTGTAVASTTSSAAPRRRVGHRRAGLPRTLSGWLTTTDHKAIGVAYAVTSLVFLAIGGALAGIIRAELAQPGMQVVDEATYNSVFTIHGSVMVYLFAVPFGFALANYLIPLQIGAPDLAFPRLNALSYWLYLFGGVIMLLGFVTDGGAASFGWTPTRRCRARPARPGSAPTCGSSRSSSPARPARSARSTSSRRSRCCGRPGMTMFRMPILTWNLFLTSFMVLLAFPVLTGALMMLEADRRFGTHFFDPRPAGRRSCGSTCSGSSATPRCTSSPCRSSAWSPRSSPCSPASRCSATGA